MSTRGGLTSILAALALLAACSGGDGGAPPPPTTAPGTTAAATTTTESPTTTEPPTTLPPTLDLASLPGRIVLEAKSCAPEPFPPYNEIPKSVICLMQPDGSGALQISVAGEDPSFPRFTRDGNHVYYAESYSRFGFLVDLTTGEHRERVRLEPLRPGISPDGKWLIYVDETGVNYLPFDQSNFLDGSEFKLVAADTHVYSGGTWAPDSTRFAYISTDDGAGGELDCGELWVGGIDGRAPVKISDFANGPDGTAGCPEWVRWSPTEDRLLVFMQGKPSYTAEVLYVVNADGSGLKALTPGQQQLDPNGSTYAMKGNSFGGDWSPDGKYIMAMLGDGSGYGMVVMNADGGQVTPVPAPLGITTSIMNLRWSLG